MSYILDAIKKAEDQRRQEQVPTLESIVSQRALRRPPMNLRKWLNWIAIVLLLAAAVWFRQPVINAVSDTYSWIAQQFNRPAAQSEPVKNAVEVVNPEVMDNQPTPESKDSTLAQSSITLAPQTDPTIPANIRRNLEKITFTVISYSADPDKRFVMDGPRVLREGDYMGDYRIAQIRREGVVLDIDGKDYIVKP